ncbi:MAG: hypothetical protein N2037_07895 [Acidimicrobiales bacterium]|nr:hypothetical protein [Acidimicrobiales bacterium]
MHPNPAGAAPGDLVVSIGNVRMWEPDVGRAAAEIPITLSFPIGREIQVLWELRPCAGTGCVTVGTDVAKPKVMVTPIRAGSGRAFVTIPILGDDVVEGDEVLDVALVGVNDPMEQVAVSSDYAQGRLTVLDDDAAGFPSRFIAMGEVEAVEGDDDDGTPVIRTLGNPVTLGVPEGQDVFVEYTVDGGTATPGVDFRTKQRLIQRIPAGHQRAALLLPAVGDTEGEFDEYATVHIHSVSNPLITVTADSGDMRILTDELPNPV